MSADRMSVVCFEDELLRLGGFLPRVEVLLKIEAFNVARSTKLKTAKRIIDDLEATGRLISGGSVQAAVSRSKAKPIGFFE